MGGQCRFQGVELLQEHFLNRRGQHIAVAFSLINLPAGQGIDIGSATGTE